MPCTAKTETSELLRLRLCARESSRERNRHRQQQHAAEQAHRDGAAARLFESVFREHRARARLRERQEDAEASRRDEQHERHRSHDVIGNERRRLTQFPSAHKHAGASAPIG